LLPGEKTPEIDYKKEKYEILDQYDDLDFNPKPNGETKEEEDEEHGHHG